MELNKLKFGFYLVLIFIFDIAKEEILLNEELVIIISFIISVSLIYSLIENSIDETLKARSTEYLVLFEKISNLNIKLLQNLKNMIVYLIQTQNMIKRKLIIGLRRSQIWTKLLKNDLKLKLVKMSELYMNKLIMIYMVNYETRKFIKK
uniref:ATP synthase F0 subunit b n=1 Tax=Heterostelium pallidum TaxID=13642 RepID=Q5ILM1_HETPA|nr:ATP synthase F0 subunit b [Heterostelium pallidum]AAU00589.1 ATP synthase F0 subunit b [Heterostelium pallidum]